MRYAFEVIAHIESAYPEKFGVPRQAGLVEGVPARIVFEKKYRRSEALRGLAGFSHIWLLWVFSESPGLSGALPSEDRAEPEGEASSDAPILAPASWSPTVRPPRLGGNERLGVFATRSPNRPNPIGLSAVRLLQIEQDGPDAPALLVDGADLMDGTPILDIKPYLPYADSVPDASGGFASEKEAFRLRVVIPEAELQKVPEEKRAPLRQVLAQRPVPAYQSEPSRVYGLAFAGCNIRFRLEGDCLTVLEIEPLLR